ncbi:MAG TPA: hypothetical protein VNB06_03640 [Thermoanaerobaculia bacterium]|nr:hypothetical protein [Thermoanaerobaculia bacterium]
MSSLQLAPAQDAVLCSGATSIAYTIRHGPRRRRTVAILVDALGVEVEPRRAVKRRRRLW